MMANRELRDKTFFAIKDFGKQSEPATRLSGKVIAEVQLILLLSFLFLLE